MEPDSEAIVCDNSMRFSERNFIFMITRIIQIVAASGLPISERKLKDCNSPLITVFYVNKTGQQKSMK